MLRRDTSGPSAERSRQDAESSPPKTTTILSVRLFTPEANIGCKPRISTAAAHRSECANLPRIQNCGLLIVNSHMDKSHHVSDA